MIQILLSRYGVEVYGIDLSTNMNAISLNHRKSMEPEVKHRVNFYVEDADKMDFPANFYDVVYRYESLSSDRRTQLIDSSRDTIMHFSDKMREKVYRNILKTLKPGGKLLVSDYCRGEKESTQEFIDYEKQRGYNLWTVKRYGKCLDDTGFSNVVAEDKTDFLISSMRRELKEFYDMKGNFINKFSQKDFEDLESVRE